MHTEISIPSHPYPVPLKALEYLSLSMVIRNSPSRPRQINVDQDRPTQNKADYSESKQTMADQIIPIFGVLAASPMHLLQMHKNVNSPE